MAIKLSSVKVDLELEAKGEWIDYPDLPGVSFKVSSLNLPAYVLARDQLLQKLTRIHKKAVPQGVLSAEMGALFAKHILHDWKGFDDPYTPEYAVEILTDPAYREIVGAVNWCAQQVAKADIEFVEDETKN